MKIILSLLSLGLAVAAIAGSIGAMGASATTPANSHFTSESTEHHLIVKGTQTYPSSHALTFQRTTLGGESAGEPVACTHVAYHGTASGVEATTTQAVSIRPQYNSCGTTGAEFHNILIHVPAACGTNVFKFTSGNPGTVHLECTITVTHPNCEIKVPPQTLNGVTYLTVVESGKHAITASLNVAGITVHNETGICVLTGTAHTYDMKGSVIFWGERTDGNRTGITAT